MYVKTIGCRCSYECVETLNWRSNQMTTLIGEETGGKIFDFGFCRGIQGLMIVSALVFDWWWWIGGGSSQIDAADVGGFSVLAKILHQQQLFYIVGPLVVTSMVPEYSVTQLNATEPKLKITTSMLFYCFTVKHLPDYVMVYQWFAGKWAIDFGECLLNSTVGLKSLRQAGSGLYPNP